MLIMIHIDVINSALWVVLLIILLKDVWQYVQPNHHIMVFNKNVYNNAQTTHTRTTIPVFVFHHLTAQTLVA